MTLSATHPAFQKLLRSLKSPQSLEHQKLQPKIMNLHIVGLTGTEGTALIELFAQRLGPHVALTGHDFSADLKESFDKAHVSLSPCKRQQKFEALLALPQLSVQTGENYLQGLETADVVFVGQNWRAYQANSPKLFALQGQVPYAQITDLYLELTRCALIGMTGTNGKTTTCHWLKAMLEHEQRRVAVSGNDLFSQQALAAVLEMPENAVLILEVSNRQARDLHRSPAIAVVTSLAPDHLDEHGGWQGYLEAKRKLVEKQQPGDIAILNYDCPSVSSYAQFTKARILWVSTKELPDGLEGAYCDAKGQLVLRLEDKFRVMLDKSSLALVGDHNARNGLSAALAAFLSGVSLEAIVAGLQNFRGVKNRLQRIARIRGVDYFNDLASTTPWSTLAGLEAFDKACHVIVGGSVKVKAGYAQLAKRLEGQAASIIALPGAVASELRRSLSDPTLLTEVASIDEAVTLASQRAKDGQQVLLSPAGSGFYSSYLGQFGSFNKAVRRLRKNRVA